MTSNNAVWEWSSDQKLECGAVTLDVEFKGEIEVVINNDRTYTLTRAEMGHDKIGGRLFDKAATVKLSAKPGTVVKKASAKAYKYYYK